MTIIATIHPLHARLRVKTPSALLVQPPQAARLTETQTAIITAIRATTPGLPARAPLRADRAPIPSAARGVIASPVEAVVSIWTAQEEPAPLAHTAQHASSWADSLSAFGTRL